MTNYLESLDKEQTEAVLAPRAPLAVMAGAGSGKTKLVTARVAHQIEEGVDPAKLFVSAFTRAAAKEMGERINNLVEAKDLDVNTFHSLMFRFMNNYRESIGLAPYGVMKEGRKKILFQKLLGKPGRDYPQAVNIDADVGNVIGQIGLWKNSMIEPGSPEIQETIEEAPMGSDILAAAKVYKHYEAILKAENLIDFDDMLLKSLNLLLEDQRALQLARSTWSEGVFIDEAQDTNIVQWGIIDQIAPPSTNPNLTVVGDLRQCLYSWRGASPEVFGQFVDRYKGAKVVDLVNNYRCSGNVVKVANRLASGLGMEDQKSTRDEGADVEVVNFDDPVDQAIAIANEVHEAAQEGISGGKFAVLVRTNAQSAPIESAFVSMGLAYWCNGGGFFDRMEVGDIMAYLRVANGSNPVESLGRIINRPTRYLGAAFVDSVVGNLDKYQGDIIKAVRLTNMYSGRKLSPKQRDSAVALSELLLSLKEDKDTPISPGIAISRILNETSYIDWLKKNSGLSDDADSQRLDNIEALRVEASRFTSIASFIEFADESSRLQFESQDSTSILTVHRAKGLEWDTVWVTNMTDDSIPHKMAKRSGDTLSEKRLAYVAFTRAENTLKIGVPAMDDKGKDATPSPFLAMAGLEATPAT